MSRLAWTLPCAAAAVLWLFGYQSGPVKWTVTFPGEPILVGRIKYDPNPADPFFETEEWSYWEGSRENPDPGMFPRGEKPTKLKHTARCVLSHFGFKREVRFSEARLLRENIIDLLIYEYNPSCNAELIVDIRNGMFRCQYTDSYPSLWLDMPWPAKRQELILDKKAYQKGDIVKGRIDVEISRGEYLGCFDTPRSTITIKGVFKTTVQ